MNHPDLPGSFSSFRNEEIAEYIAQQPKSCTISVLLSGDTGFYSGAKKLAGLLKSRFPDDRLEQLAGISSLQYFCAKLQTGWDDVKLFSVHGRQEQVVPQVRRHPRVFVLTGSNQTAQDVCKQLCEQGLGDAQVWVGEQLSYPQERILSGTAEQLAQQSFDPLAVMLIEHPVAPARDYPPLGLDDSEFLRATTEKPVPMTKQEIRAVALSKLRITRDACVYDIGAGTGSVTVEAALIANGGRVYAVEKNPQALSQLQENLTHFGLNNVQVVAGAAPQAMQPLPAPDFVFVGGSSGSIAEHPAPVPAKKFRGCAWWSPPSPWKRQPTCISAVKQLREQGCPLKLEITQISAARAKIRRRTAPDDGTESGVHLLPVCRGCTATIKTGGVRCDPTAYAGSCFQRKRQNDHRLRHFAGAHPDGGAPGQLQVRTGLHRPDVPPAGAGCPFAQSGPLLLR